MGKNEIGPEAPEIEITPAMIEAGVRALDCWEPYYEVPADVVAEIYKAMERVKAERPEADPPL